MKQKRKVKSLISKKNYTKGKLLTALLLVLSLALCIGSVSLLTNSVSAQSAATDDNEVEVVVYHYYTYFDARTCDIKSTRDDSYQYGTVGHPIKISLDEELIEAGYDLAYVNYYYSGGSRYSGQSLSYQVRPDVNNVYVFYTVADNEEDENGNNVPDVQEKKQSLYVYYQYGYDSGDIAERDFYEMFFNERYTKTGKSVDSYYFNPEVITGVKKCGNESIIFTYTAKPECDRNANGVCDEEEKTVTIKHEYPGGIPIVTKKRVVISGSTFKYFSINNFPEEIVYDYIYSVQPTSIFEEVTGDMEFTITYYPNHDCNGSGVPDEEEVRQVTINYSCEVGGKPYECDLPSYVTGYELNKSFNTPVPQVPGYGNVDPDKTVIEGSCTDQTVEVVLTLSGPERDVNVNGINDCEEVGGCENLGKLWEIHEFDYTGLDNKVEVLYAMRFMDPTDFTRVVNSIYMSGSSLYIAPNPVIVDSSTNQIEDGVYSHILGGENNKVYAKNITLIAGSNNKVRAGNDNASVLGGNGNEVMPGNGVPAILVGGESNVMGTGHDGNALIGGKNNRIEENNSDSFILGGENNFIGGQDGGFPVTSENVIVGGKNVHIEGINNIFVYSSSGNYDNYFSPRTPNAFYLNVEDGVGINTDGSEGLSVDGAVSIGKIDINGGGMDMLCNNSNLGVIGSYQGCLVGCTYASLYTGGKWEMLDQGSKCAHICQNNSDWCLHGDMETVRINNYDAQCTEGVVNTGHAHLCIDDLGSYENVVFESSLIDSEEECPNGQNICVYQCDAGYHLTGDRTTGKVGCYSDCEMVWKDGTVEKNIQHGEIRVGYNTGQVYCSKDNPSGTIPETCVNNNHKRNLVCSDGMMYLATTKDGNKPNTTKIATGSAYTYKDCGVGGYRCNTGVYNLSRSYILGTAKDTITSRNTVDRKTTTGDRGIYKLCLDYDPEVGVNNKCNVINGKAGDGGYVEHYQLKACKDHYSTGTDNNPYECKKDCEIKDISGNIVYYKHNTSLTGYESNSVECPGVCVGSQLVCNDGEWRLGNKVGPKANGERYDDCNSQNKTCGSDFNVSRSDYNSGKDTGFYDVCTGYNVQGNICTILDPVYKLTGCYENYHTENGKWCRSNTDHRDCSMPSDGKPLNSHYITGRVSITWDGTWNEGEWTSPKKCSWTCDSGYDTGYDASGKPISCVNLACGSDANTCADTGATITPRDNNGDGNGDIWTCQAPNSSHLNRCPKCDEETSYATGENETLRCDANVNGKCGTGAYECLSGDKYERGETEYQYNWDCLGRGNGTGDRGCYKCKDGYRYEESLGRCELISYSCGWDLDTVYMCEDEDEGEFIPGTNTGFDEDKYTWDCGETPCELCSDGNKPVGGHCINLNGASCCESLPSNAHKIESGERERDGCFEEQIEVEEAGTCEKKSSTYNPNDTCNEYYPSCANYTSQTDCLFYSADCCTRTPTTSSPGGHLSGTDIIQTKNSLFNCNSGYHLSGSCDCVSNNRTGNCKDAPLNNGGWTWNNGGTYTQTWNGTAWIPTALYAQYIQDLPTSVACSFRCNSGYMYDMYDNNSCKSCSDICEGNHTTYWQNGICYNSTCFTAGTKVIMVDGVQRNIEDVKIGEKVLGSNGTINTVLGYDRPVLGDRHLWSINGGDYFVSDEHPFMTTEGWKSFNPEMTKLEIDLETKELKVGDVLITNNGLEEIKFVDYVDAEADTPLFNLVLDGDHTYYANGYLVHNKQPVIAVKYGDACKDGTYPVGANGGCCPNSTYYNGSYCAPSCK